MNASTGLFLALALAAAGATEPQGVVFYAQLIRGTDQDQPTEASWRPAGPRLSKHLAPKFRWKNYWEINRQSVCVLPGKTRRVSLNSNRDVEIDLNTPGESEIRLYNRGVLIRKSKQPVNTAMSIMGGTRPDDESWFVVVRRNKPSAP